MLYAGIDWADQHHDTLVLDETGRQMGSIRVDHTPEGLAKLNTFLEKLTGPDKEQVACIVETNHGLAHCVLCWRQAGPSTRSIHGQWIDVESASGAKTDPIDAYLLAKTGRADLADLRRLTPDSELVAGTQSPDPRPGCPDPDADAPGQPTHGLPQSVLSGRAFLVRQGAAALDVALPANLPYAASRHGRFGGADHPGPQERWSYDGEESGTQDFRDPASAALDRRCDHHAHEIALDAGIGRATGAPGGADRRL